MDSTVRSQTSAGLFEKNYQRLLDLSNTQDIGLTILAFHKTSNIYRHEFRHKFVCGTDIETTGHYLLCYRLYTLRYSWCYPPRCFVQLYKDDVMKVSERLVLSFLCEYCNCNMTNFLIWKATNQFLGDF